MSVREEEEEWSGNNFFGGGAMGFGNGVGSGAFVRGWPVWVERGAKEMSLERLILPCNMSSLSVVELQKLHALLGNWSRCCSFLAHDCVVYTAYTVLSCVCFRLSSLNVCVVLSVLPPQCTTHSSHTRETVR